MAVIHGMAEDRREKARVLLLVVRHSHGRLRHVSRCILGGLALQARPTVINARKIFHTDSVTTI